MPRLSEYVIGRKFGSLTITKQSVINCRTHCVCKCDCGKTKVVLLQNLKSGRTKSCGKCNRVQFSYGHQIHSITVLDETKRGKDRHIWFNCQCACGRVVKFLGRDLRNERKTNCGCLDVHIHVARRPKLYATWAGMWARCYSKNHPAYRRYGGRGIEICERWWDYTTFERDMGRRESGMTLDRIDVNKGYSPWNCRWASKIDQANNRYTNKKYRWQGRDQTIAQLARLCFKPYSTLYYRLEVLKWNVVDAMYNKRGWHETETYRRGFQSMVQISRHCVSR